MTKIKGATTKATVNTTIHGTTHAELLILEIGKGYVEIVFEGDRHVLSEGDVLDVKVAFDRTVSL